MLFAILLIAASLGGEKAGALSLGVLALMIAYYVLYAVAVWKLFAKSGRPGWWGFVPVLNRYQVYKLSWNTTAFWIALVLGVASAVISKQDQSSTIMSIVAIAVALGGIIVEVKFNLNLAKAYGKGVGFGIALLFFQAICTMILGLGDAKYEGPQA